MPEGSEGSDRQPMRRRAILLTELAVMLAGAAVVLWGTWHALAPGSLWIDDAWVALAAKAQGPSQLAATMITAHGFVVLLAGWMGLAGTQGLAPQFLPLVFGMLAPGLLFLGLRRAARWPMAAATLATVMVATSPLVVTFSGRVKQYTLDVVLAAALTSAALAIAAAPTRRRLWSLTAASLGALAMSAATAGVGAAAMLVGVVALLVEEAGGAAKVRVRHLGAVLGPSLAFAGVGAAWGLGVLARTIPPGMYAFWEAEFLPVDEGVRATMSAIGNGFFGVADAMSPLAPGWLQALAAAGLLWAAWTRPPLAVMISVPALVTLTLSALQRAPWGGGRTESQLVVAFAVAVAALVLPRPRREQDRAGIPATPVITALRRAHAGAGALLAVIVAGAVLTHVERPTYPQQDLQPLLVQMETRIADDEVVLVYAFSRYAYGLYTPAPVTFKPNPGNSIGYAITVDDPRVRLLPSHRGNPSLYLETVAGLVNGACGVWFASSHIRDDERSIIGEAVAAAGFILDGTPLDAPGAEVSHWRSPTC